MNPDDIEALGHGIAAEFPACDVLINNAGIMRNLNVNAQHALTEATQEIDVALRGPIQMVQALLPLLKQREEALIVNVPSGLAFIPFPLSPVYSAAKAGLHAYTRCLRVQLRGSRVAVVELAPPGTETKLFRDEFRAELKDQKAMPVKTLPDRAIAGIESGKAEIRPGLSNLLYLLSQSCTRTPIRPYGKDGSGCPVIGLAGLVMTLFQKGLQGFIDRSGCFDRNDMRRIRDDNHLRA